ncbi:unnamed protein product [Rangifer tarandus platyrhynchus]|uniref:Uncharacterized protein n=2 Tax=Rangifer tarandus platyrhynchus TaxID=3082113 RepID=A0ABN8XU19_RANTA|nr:unnamed protein product [Rangifer tarandus platyrhynchus]
MRKFTGGSVVKNPPATAGDSGDTGSGPGLGRSSGRGNGNPFQYSCLNNHTNRGVWQLQSMGLQRVGYYRMTKHACMRNFKTFTERENSVINLCAHITPENQQEYSMLYIIYVYNINHISHMFYNYYILHNTIYFILL